MNLPADSQADKHQNPALTEYQREKALIEKYQPDAEATWQDFIQNLADIDPSAADLVHRLKRRVWLNWEDEEDEPPHRKYPFFQASLRLQTEYEFDAIAGMQPLMRVAASRTLLNYVFAYDEARNVVLEVLVPRDWADPPPSDESITASIARLDQLASNRDRYASLGIQEVDGFRLTGIEADFYQALKESDLMFSPQCWIVDGGKPLYRVDFMVFHKGNAVVVEVDGHDAHKTKAQRERDAQRDRFFTARGIPTIRFTGSEIKRSPMECVMDVWKCLTGDR